MPEPPGDPAGCTGRPGAAVRWPPIRTPPPARPAPPPTGQAGSRETGVEELVLRLVPMAYTAVQDMDAWMRRHVFRIRRIHRR